MTLYHISFSPVVLGAVYESMKPYYKTIVPDIYWLVTSNNESVLVTHCHWLDVFMSCEQFSLYKPQIASLDGFCLTAEEVNLSCMFKVSLSSRVIFLVIL